MFHKPSTISAIRFRSIPKLTSISVEIDINRILESKGITSEGLKALWRKNFSSFLDTFDQSEPADDWIGTWFLAVQNPKSLSLLKPFIKETSTTDGYREFCEHVDESDYSIGEWMEAIELFYLNVKNPSSEIDPILGYISCSAQFSSKSGVQISLAKVVEEMIAQYGFHPEKKTEESSDTG